MHVVFTQNLFDSLNAGLNRSLVTCSAVLAQQILKNIRWNNGVAFDGLDKILADNKPGKMSVYLLVKSIHSV